MDRSRLAAISLRTAFSSDSIASRSKSRAFVDTVTPTVCQQRRAAIGTRSRPHAPPRGFGGAYSSCDRRPRRARRTARTARRLRVAPAPFALQGLGPRVRLELPHTAAAARRVLDPFRRAPRHAAAHRDGGAVLRGVPFRWPPAMDLLRELAPVRRRVD